MLRKGGRRDSVDLVKGWADQFAKWRNNAKLGVMISKVSSPAYYSIVFCGKQVLTRPLALFVPPKTPASAISAYRLMSFKLRISCLRLTFVNWPPRSSARLYREDGVIEEGSAGARAFDCRGT